MCTFFFCRACNPSQQLFFFRVFSSWNQRNWSIPQIRNPLLNIISCSASARDSCAVKSVRHHLFFGLRSWFFSSCPPRRLRVLIQSKGFLLQIPRTLRVSIVLLRRGSTSFGYSNVDGNNHLINSSVHLWGTTFYTYFANKRLASHSPFLSRILTVKVKMAPFHWHLVAVMCVVEAYKIVQNEGIRPLSSFMVRAKMLNCLFFCYIISVSFIVLLRSQASFYVNRSSGTFLRTNRMKFQNGSCTSLRQSKSYFYLSDSFMTTFLGAHHRSLRFQGWFSVRSSSSKSRVRMNMDAILGECASSGWSLSRVLSNRSVWMTVQIPSLQISSGISRKSWLKRCPPLRARVRIDPSFWGDLHLLCHRVELMKIIFWSASVFVIFPSVWQSSANWIEQANILRNSSFGNHCPQSHAWKPLWTLLLRGFAAVWTRMSSRSRGPSASGLKVCGVSLCFSGRRFILGLRMRR